jgi:uncharacterized protein (DUF1499 family)
LSDRDDSNTRAKTRAKTRVNTRANTRANTPAIPRASPQAPAMAPASRPPGLRRRALLAALGATTVSAAAVAALAVGAGRLGLWAGAAPADLGVRDGRLAPPSTRPNSVSSQARLWPDHPRREAAHIEPLPLLRADAASPAVAGEGIDPAAAGAATLRRIAALLAGVPGTEIVTQRPDYLHVAFTTRWMRFVDDAEFWLDPAEGVIQLRSASRLGYSDGGLNRARIEALRSALAAG